MLPMGGYLGILTNTVKMKFNYSMIIIASLLLALSNHVLLARVGENLQTWGFSLLMLMQTMEKKRELEEPTIQMTTLLI